MNIEIRRVTEAEIKPRKRKKWREKKKSRKIKKNLEISYVRRRFFYVKIRSD